MRGCIDFYNAEIIRYKNASEKIDIDEFVRNDASKISWTDKLKKNLERKKEHRFEEGMIVSSVYRPFSKLWLYYDRYFNQRQYQIPKFFPDNMIANKVISITAPGARQAFSALIVDRVPDLHVSPDGAQCFPLQLYELIDAEENRPNPESPQPDFFDDAASRNLFDVMPPEYKKYRVKDGITDAGLQHFQHAYPGEQIIKEDVFYYTYGLLHSEEYKSLYADNLTKELPRIPAVKTAVDFWSFSEAGRALAELHIGYEAVEPHPIQFILSKPFAQFSPADYRVTQMKFTKGNNGERHDKTSVIYNHNVTMTGIPLEAYDYVVNGKSALEWVMERQAVTTHKESGIINDANDWAIETMNNPAYPLELFLRVITVSLETMKIVRSLPPLEV